MQLGKQLISAASTAACGVSLRVPQPIAELPDSAKTLCPSFVDGKFFGGLGVHREFGDVFCVHIARVGHPDKSAGVGLCRIPHRFVLPEP